LFAKALAEALALKDLLTDLKGLHKAFEAIIGKGTFDLDIRGLCLEGAFSGNPLNARLKEHTGELTFWPAFWKDVI